MSRYNAAVFLAVALGAASPAFAEDWQVGDLRFLGDPAFLPYAGQIEGEFQYSYQVGHYDFRNSDALYPSEYHRQDNLFLPELVYGITDDISVFANLQWGNARNREFYTYNRVVFQPTFTLVPTRGVQGYHSLGADDPSFGVTWRAIDQRSAPVNLDIQGSYHPDIFRARNAAATGTGSIATGGQGGSLQVSVSRVMPLFTLRAFGTFSYEGRRNLLAASGSDLRAAAHPAYAVGLQAAVRPVSFLEVNVGANAQQAVRYDEPSIAGPFVTPITVKPSGSVSPYVELVVPVIPQHVVAGIGYQHDFINDESRNLPFGQTELYYKQQSNVFFTRLLVTIGGPAAPAPAPPPSPPPPQLPREFGWPRTYLVFFDWDRADLSARARQIIAEAARVSTAVQTTRIEVDGYTDLSGTAAYNQRLSVRRARSVQAELIRDGIAPAEIDIHGYGETHPLVPTAKGIREPQNRRVEIILK